MKLLMIGDNESSIEFLKTLYPPPPHFSSIACIFSEAEQMILNEKPDIILVDIAISTQEGVDICGTLHSFTTTPIIVLSVSNNPQYIAGILDAGADDFLVKPISFDILYAKINKILRRVNIYSQPIII
jgi:DNA-binding response OmpR family regulator